MAEQFASFRENSEIMSSSDDEVVDQSNLYRRNSSNPKTKGKISISYKSTDSNHQSEEIVDSSDDSDEDDEPIVRTKKKDKCRLLWETSDESDASPPPKASTPTKNCGDSEVEEEIDFEKKAFSPRTRRSIGGYQLAITDDESSDGNESTSDSKDAMLPINNSEELHSINPEAPPRYENSDKDEVDFEKQAFSPKTRRSIGGYKLASTDDESSDGNESTGDSKDAMLPINNSELHKSPETSFRHENSNTDKIIKEEHSAPNNRISQNFNSSIATKMSSTIVPETKPSNSPDLFSIASSNSAAAAQSPIEISSSDDSIVAVASTSRNLRQGASKPRVIELPDEQTPNNNHSLFEYVSQEEYDRNLKRLSELKHELSTCENLVKTVASQLPDKGKRMSGRTESLKADIRTLAEHVSKLKVDVSLSKPRKPSIEFVQPKITSWEEIDTAANNVQSKYTGKVGMSNFVAQKALTLEKLKDIHGSIESCPADDVLADEPKYLKISLMDHQRHALAWMEWREKQKPRGGILADDMGLGKTLTMISLILAAREREEQGDSEEEQDDENDNDSWTSKGKRDLARGGTLVVCPASLIHQWEGEVENRVKRNKLAVCVYHGNNRETRSRRLAKYDMVITTYNLISREYKSNGCIFGVKWNRIILDEAHMIRNHKSQSSESVCRLNGIKRWALTGTPIQNKEMDLFALLKFLRCSPFDVLSHYKQWIDNKSAGGQQRLNTLMKSLLLRRTKEQLKVHGTITLPQRELQLIEFELDRDEQVVYQKVLLYSRTLFGQYLYQRAEKNQDLMFQSEGNRPTFMQKTRPNEAFLQMHQRITRLDRRTEVKTHEILVLLLRLRQICCHTGLIDAMLEDEENLSVSGDNHHSEIDLLEHLNKMKITDGQPMPLSESLDKSKEDALSKALSKVLIKSNPVFDLKRTSSKMRNVIEVVENRILNSTDKAVVVSQWTSFLELLRIYLAKKRIPFVCLNGSVPPALRNNMVKDFNDPSSKTKIMLLSLTAGGVGLNLVGANHLILTDLHWNPQLESQAQDRIYRVGQQKTVNVYKLICKETIEERIKILQDNKLAIADTVLTGVKSNSGSKLTIDDLKSLFGI